MKKFILSMFVIASFGFYVISQVGGNSSNDLGLPPVVSSVSNSSNKKQQQTLNTTESPAIVASSSFNSIKDNISGFLTGGSNNESSSVKTVKIKTPKVTSTTKQVALISKTNGLYNDGSYSGSSVDAYYGNVQVEAVISNGKLSDVQFLDYPHDARNSQRISSKALPILKQEAIQAQSANIDAVSGASYTSPAFIKSLTSALDKASV